VVLFVFDNNLFSPIFLPSEVPGTDWEGIADGSFFRFTVGAARIVSWAQSLHGPFESSFLAVDVDFFDGPTVAVVVAERLETTAVLLDMDGISGVDGVLIVASFNEIVYLRKYLLALFSHD